MMVWAATAAAVVGAGASIYSASKNSGSTTTTTEMPRWQQQPTKEYYGALESGGQYGGFMNNYDPQYFPGQQVAPLSDQYKADLQGFRDSAYDPNSSTGQAEAYRQSVLSGDYLGLSDPMRNAVMNPAMDATAGRFAQMGRYGSPASQSSMLQSAMTATMPYYNAERGRQESAASALPMFDTERFNRSTAQSGVLQNQTQAEINAERAKWDFGQNQWLDRMQQWGGLLNAGRPPQTTTMTPAAGNPLAAGIGGAIAGGQLGSNFGGSFDGWGSGFGGTTSQPASSYLGTTSQWGQGTWGDPLLSPNKL